MSDPEKRGVSITPKRDGPYVVKNLERLAGPAGPLAAGPTVALCRCGGSATKPFCDGTHKRNGFSSAKLEGRTPDRRDEYRGRAITIHDNRGVCAHAGMCTDALPAVFRYRQEPWIDPEAAPAPAIAAVVRRCPSGALAYTLPEDDAAADAQDPPAIFVAPNGPYVVSGGPPLLDTPFGEGASKERFALCRCGGSKNKPFCDGTHWTNGFAG